MAKPTKSELVLQHTIVNAGSPTSPSASNSISSLYVGDLEENVDEGQLFDLFNEVTRVHSVRISRNEENGVSFGYGYVNFTTSQDETTTEEDLVQVFGKFGFITSVVIMRDMYGKSKCFGFVNFQDPKAATDAIEGLNNAAWNRLDRKFQYEQMKEANLYIKNLDETIRDDEKLKALFSPFGTITSCKIMFDSRGVSKGFGFVAFSTREEAKKAMIEMNRKMVGRKALYVSVAERKKQRAARLQAQFSQARASGSVTDLSTDKTRVLWGAPGLQSPGYDLTNEPIMVGYGPSNFMAPVIRTGSTHAMLGQVMSDSTPNQDLVNVFSGRNLMDQVVMGNNMVQLPFDVTTEVTSSSDVHLSGPIDTRKLASVLASASRENQHRILRAYLYPLVEQIEHKNATSVTDMLLEMDNYEVLHLIESPNELKKKVGEAMALLISAPSCVANDEDHFGSLSLN
ncbi:unnamed protein product [Lactuca saligna]|uniref:Polyadenylate-binding protein n=1 Tax=Lactuca saligna TaxID=75948 RepID=A0AA35Y640_LACSI|nr:unnamed protein product [Lactuca saligna]